jgi:hypothetical protein
MHYSVLVTKHFSVYNECVHNEVAIRLAWVYDTAIVIYAYLFLRLSPLLRNTSFKDGNFKADVRYMVYIVDRVLNHGSTSNIHSPIRTNYNAPSWQVRYFHRCRPTNCCVVSTHIVMEGKGGEMNLT